MPYLKGGDKTPPHARLFWRHRDGSWAVRKGDWKLVQDPEGNRHLFEIVKDISERYDVIKAKPEIAARLAKDWDQWNASNAGCIPWFPPGQSQWPADLP